MMFTEILTGLLPIFLMIILGGLLRNRLSENAWQGLDRLNFEILFPALLFVAASSRPIEVSQLIAIGPAVWVIVAVGFALGWTARPLGPERFLDFAGAWQTAWRFNAAVALVTAAALSAASVALMAVVIGMAVPIANLFAVSALSSGNSLGFKGTVKKVALNPFLLASLAGVGFGVSGIEIPAPILTPLKMLAQAAIPLALIAVGATMNWGALARIDRFMAALNGVKLIALPTLTLAAIMIIGQKRESAAILVLFAAIPTAAASHTLAAGFGADRELPATLVAQSTLISIVTLPAWITIVAFLFP